MALVGAAAVQLAAVRRLFTSGFSPQARLVTRTLLETIDLAVVSSYDSAFAIAYSDNEESGNGRRFWHTHVARGQLHGRLREIEGRFHADQRVVDDMWRERKLSIADLSREVHPTFLGALFHVYAVPPLAPQKLRPSLEGQADLKNLGVLVTGVGSVLYLSGMLFRPVATNVAASKFALFMKFVPIRIRCPLIAQAAILGKLEETFYPGLAQESHRLSELL